MEVLDDEPVIEQGVARMLTSRWVGSFGGEGQGFGEGGGVAGSALGTSRTEFCWQGIGR
jgi:hypothetical protein